MAAKRKALSNKELYIYKPSTGLFAREPSTFDKLWRVFTQLVLYSLWRAVASLGGPLKSCFGVQIWMGKSVLAIVQHIQRLVFRLIGWLSGREASLSRTSNFYFGTDVKRWHVGLVAVILGSLVHSGYLRIQERYDERKKQRRALHARMLLSQSYQEWRSWALQIEKLDNEQALAGGYKVPSVLEAYDRRLLLQKTTHLRCIRASGIVGEMMHAVRIDLIRNVANIAKSQKHCQNFVSVPEPIQCYMQEVKDQLQQICDWPDHELSVDDKLAFFRVTRHTFGRTALLLSGGGGLGIFHLGVCRGLFECKLLPRILAGSSVGSIVCAAMCVRTDAELRDTFDDLVKFDMGFFQDNNCYAMMKQAIEKGHLHDMDTMIGKLRELLGDCTFAEAYERTGRILNVTVCPADTNEPPRLLNYMTAPNVLVWSGVAASSSFPGLYPPQFLVGHNSQGQICRMHQDVGVNSLQRRWRDGSLEFDLPAQALGEMFNCNHFLVSQTNPHIVPLLNFKSLFPQWWAAFMEAELKHRLSMLQCFVPAWTKWLTLFTQPWEGDITFTLPSSLWNIRKTVVNPTVQDLQAAVRAGEQTVWERMPAIECNCTLEAMLDKCVAKVQHQVRGRNSSLVQPNSNRLPSFVNLPNGMHNFPTWGDSIAGNDISQVTSWGDFSSLESNPPGLHVQPLYRSPHGDSLVELALGRDAKQHVHRQLPGEHHPHSRGAASYGMFNGPDSGHGSRLPPISSRTSSTSGSGSGGGGGGGYGDADGDGECASTAGGRSASSHVLERWATGGTQGSHHGSGHYSGSGSGSGGGGFVGMGLGGGGGRGGLSRKSSCLSRLSALAGQESGEEGQQLQGAGGSGSWGPQLAADRTPGRAGTTAVNGSAGAPHAQQPAAPASFAAVTAAVAGGGGGGGPPPCSNPASAQHSMRSSLSVCDSVGSNAGFCLAHCASHRVPLECPMHSRSPSSAGEAPVQGASAAAVGAAPGAALGSADSSNGSQGTAHDCAMEQRIFALAQGSCPESTTRILGSFLPLAGVSEQLTEPHAHTCSSPAPAGGPH